MADGSDMLGRPLERYREYLRQLVGAQIGSRLQGKLDASDLVQQTMLKAHERRRQFRGTTEAELASWLRRILARSLADAVRQFTGGARNARLERSLEAALDGSSARLEACLAADRSSPPQVAQRNENLVRLAGALAQLPDDQRRAVELHHLQALPLDEVARRMGRGKRAIAGLLFRALRRVRASLEEPASE